MSDQLQGRRLAIPSLALLLLASCARSLDPAAWGRDHVGKPVPVPVGGDECLFCHREAVGTVWGKNRHNRTIRDASPDSPAVRALRSSGATHALAAEMRYLLGERNVVRFLRPSGYGKLAIHSTAWIVAADGDGGRLELSSDPRWDETAFGSSCAGCHSTGVDPSTQAFSALSLDCSVCHGNVDLAHTRGGGRVVLSGRGEDSARVVTSICSQCHLRGGRSRSTGLPYSNNFVAGDNLFRDLDFDFRRHPVTGISVADRHVVENVAAVVLRGEDDVTCLSCHDVHKQSSSKHRRLQEGDLCLTCHGRDELNWRPGPITNGSKICGT